MNMISRKHKTDGDGQLRGPPDKKMKESDKFDLWGDDDELIDAEISKVDDETLSQCASQSIHVVNKNVLGPKSNFSNSTIPCSIIEIDSQSSFKENPASKDPLKRAREEIDSYKMKLEEMRRQEYQKDGEIHNLRQSMRQKDELIKKMRSDKLDSQEKAHRENFEKIKSLQKEVERYKGELAFRNHEMTETEQFCKKLTHEMEMNSNAPVNGVTPVKCKRKSPAKPNNDFPSKTSFLMDTVGPSESLNKGKNMKNNTSLKVIKKRDSEKELLRTRIEIGFYKNHLLTDTFLSSLQENEVLEIERAIYHLFSSNIGEHNEVEAIAASKRLLPFLLEHINNYLRILSITERNYGLPTDKITKLFRDSLNILIYLVADRSLLIMDWLQKEKETEVKMDIDDPVKNYASPISLLASFFVPNLNYGSLKEKYLVLTEILKTVEKISYVANTNEDIFVLVKRIFLYKSINRVMLEMNDSHRDNEEYAKFCLQLLNLMIRICSFPDVAKSLCSKSNCSQKVEFCVYKALLYTMKSFRRRGDGIKVEVAEKVILLCQTMIYSCDGNILQAYCRCSTEISRCLILYTHSLYSLLFKEQLSGEKSLQEFESDNWLKRNPQNRNEERLIILIRRGLTILKKLGITFRYVEANCQNVLKEFIELYQVIDRWLFGVRPYTDIDSPMCSLWDLGGDN